MRTILFAALLFCAVAVQAQTVPTRVSGNASLTNQLNVSSRAVKLYTASAYNTSGSTVYLQVSTNNPASGSVPIYSYPILASQYTAYDFGQYGADIDSCTISLSTTLSTLTLASAGTGNINAIIRSN